MMPDDLPLQPETELLPAALEPFGQEETLGALALLHRLPTPEEQGIDDWLPESSLAAMVETAERLRLAHREDRSLAPDLAARLERHPETRARMLIENRRRFRTWGLAEELLDRSHQAIFDADPCRAVRIARLAVTVADRLEPFAYSGPLTADLRARCWGSLGDTYRRAGRLGAASRALERADELLLEGTGDPLEGAQLLGYRASLTTALGDYEGAVAVLHEVCDLYEEIGETELLARTLVKLCTPYGFLDPDQGAETAHEAQKLLDPETDAELFLMARHDQIRCLIQAGKPEQATMLLEGSRKYYRRSPHRSTQLELAWTEARLAAATGRLHKAERAYPTLLREMLERGNQLDSAMVALELAATRIALGEFRKAAELASTMARHLRRWGAHPRARSAWAVLQHGLEAERATCDLVREVAHYLQRSWYNPDLRLPRVLAREADDRSDRLRPLRP